MQNNVVFVAINSTHKLTSVSFDGINALELKEHAILEKITVDGSAPLDPKVTLKGNTNDSRWTIAAFPLTIVSATGTYDVIIKGIGGGHDVISDFTVIIPTIAASVNKLWINGPKTPVEVVLKHRVEGGEYVKVVRDGIINPVTLTANSEGKATYIWENLQITNAIGLTYDYIVQENDPGQGYTVNSVTTYDAESLTYVINLVNTYTRIAHDLEIEKVWDGGIPVPITINLYRSIGLNGEKVLHDTVTLDGVVDSNSGSKEYAPYKYIWKNIDQTSDNGDLYIYTIDELEVPVNFTKTISSDGRTITNKYTSPLIDVIVNKVWIDGPDTHPDIELQLLRNGLPHLDKVTLVNGTLNYTFENLALTDHNGVPYIYTVDEVNVPENYTKTISEDGLTITNTYASPKTDITGVKVWSGGPEVHPDIQLQLFRNGVAHLDPVTLSDGKLAHTFTDLDVTDINGNAYVYTVDEVNTPENYTKTISEDGLTITNTYVSPKTDITGVKIWNGGLDTRPDIQLQLFRNGVAHLDPITLTNGLETYTWTNLDETDQNGNAYVYTVDEINVPENYTRTISEDGLTITNTYVSPKTDITGVKVWSGGPELHPDIQLQLFRNGVAHLDPITLANGLGSHTWTNLDTTDQNGNTYVYTVNEISVPENYTRTISEDGLTITNTYVSPKTDITGVKVWIGGPTTHPNIELQLFRNGEAYLDIVTLSNTEVSYTFFDLDLFDKDGVAYVYTVDEINVPTGYIKSVSEDGLTITNRFIVEQVLGEENFPEPPVKQVVKTTVKTGVGNDIDLFIFIIVGALAVLYLLRSFRRKMNY